MAARTARPQLRGMTTTTSTRPDAPTETIADAHVPQAGPSASSPASPPLGVGSLGPPAVPRHACVIPRPGEAPVCGEVVEPPSVPLSSSTDKDR